MINLHIFNFNEFNSNDDSSPVPKTPSPINGVQATTHQVFDSVINDTPRKKKSVSFHHTAFVVLIPTVAEYHDAGLTDVLWWNDADFISFKTSAAVDCREYKKNNPTSEISVNEIINKLALEEISQEGKL